MTILNKLYYLACVWFIGKGLVLLIWNLFYLINHGFGYGAEFGIIAGALFIFSGLLLAYINNKERY